MRKIGKVVLWGCLFLACLAAVTYIGDDLWARYRGRPTEQMNVGRLYSDVNRYNETEFSVGTPVMETCVDAFMPHFGYKPCWYLRKHDIEKISP